VSLPGQEVHRLLAELGLRRLITLQCLPHRSSGSSVSNDAQKGEPRDRAAITWYPNEWQQRSFDPVAE
jgi:hypothetical protein